MRNAGRTAFYVLGIVGLMLLGVVFSLMEGFEAVWNGLRGTWRGTQELWMERNK